MVNKDFHKTLYPATGYGYSNIITLVWYNNVCGQDLEVKDGPDIQE